MIFFLFYNKGGIVVQQYVFFPVRSIDIILYALQIIPYS